ncbi:MAG TPA: MFS transporter [Cyclobacteriaceae bacterium]
MTTEKHYYKLSSNTGKWTVSSCIIATSMAFIDTTALNVVLPALQQDLNATGTDLFWVLNSYLVMLASLIIIGGSLGDKLGRVMIFKWGILIFTVASALCGLSDTISQLTIFRTMQGLGGALMIPGSLSIISATFSDLEKGKAIGTWSATTTLVTIGGPVIGGALADMGLWRLIFFINIPLGILTFLILQFKVPESREGGDNHQIDWFGATALAFSLASLTFGFLNVPEAGIATPNSYVPVLLGIFAFIIFILIERKISQPMVPLNIFSNRCFSGVNLLSFFLYAALGAIMLFLSLNLIQVQGYTQLQAGLTFLPFTLVMALSARKIGALSDKWGTRNFLIIGPLITGVGFIMLAMVNQTSGPSSFWATFFPGILFFATGMAITVVPLTTTVMRSVKDDQAGIASGVNNSVTRIAGTFINAIVGAGVVFIFLELVDEEIKPFSFEAPVKNAIQNEAINLGDATVPSVVPKNNFEAVRLIFNKSFICVYQLVSYVCAGLAFIGSFIALLMVENYKGKH